MRTYGRPEGIIETDYGQFRWGMDSADSVVLDNDPQEARTVINYVTGASEERPAFPGSKAKLRGVTYSVRAELVLHNGLWQIGTGYGIRLKRDQPSLTKHLPIGVDAWDKIGTALLGAWGQFIGLQPLLPHLAHRYHMSNRLNSAVAERDELQAKLAKAQAEVVSLTGQCKEAHFLVYDLARPDQRAELDTGKQG